MKISREIRNLLDFKPENEDERNYLESDFTLNFKLVNELLSKSGELLRIIVKIRN